MQVCNHPDLFERRQVQSPFVSLLPDYELPCLVFHEGDCVGTKFCRCTVYSDHGFRVAWSGASGDEKVSISHQ